MTAPRTIPELEAEIAALKARIAALQGERRATLERAVNDDPAMLGRMLAAMPSHGITCQCDVCLKGWGER